MSTSPNEKDEQPASQEEPPTSQAVSEEDYEKIREENDAAWKDAVKEITEKTKEENWSEVEEKATDLLNHYASAFSFEGESEMTLQSSFLAGVYNFRGLARFKCGNNDGAIEDYTKALDMFPADYDYDMTETSLRVTCFMKRAEAYQTVEDHENVFSDLRASYALIRSAGDDWKTSPMGNQFEAVKIMHKILYAAGRLKKNSPRPHYTHDERKALEKELAINMYSKKKYRCKTCGKDGTDDNVKLCLCTGCEVTWYCGRDCQKRAWKRGHKKDCWKDPPIAVTPDQDRARLPRLLEGKVTVDGYSDNIHLFIKDESSGRVFDSLSDRDMYFLPSEFHLVPNEYKDMARSTGLVPANRF